MPDMPLPHTHGPDWDVPPGSKAEFRCRVYLPEAISRVRLPAHAVDDVIRHLLYPGAGDTAGSEGQEKALDGESWRHQKEFERIDAGLEYVFLDGGRVWRGAAAMSASGSFGAQGLSGVGGFYAKPQLHRRNFRMIPELVGYPSANARYPNLYWRAVQGGFDSILSPQGATITSHWVTRAPYNEAQPSSRIYHRSQRPDATNRVRTVRPLEAGQQWLLTLGELQVAHGQTQAAGYRIQWGDRYSLCFREGHAPTFDVRGEGRGGSGGGAARRWQTLRALSEFGETRGFTGDLLLACEIINGCLALSLNGMGFYIQEAAADGRTLRHMTLKIAPHKS